MHHALDDGALADPSSVVELGSLVAGTHPGRTSDDQITICDLTGVGVQDTTIARLAFTRAAERGLGVVIDS